MSRQPAKLLAAADLRLALAHVRSQRHAYRNHVLLLLSFKAGLRACEIAGLTWPMVLAPDGSVGRHIHIGRAIAKYGSARQIPLHQGVNRRANGDRDRRAIGDQGLMRAYAVAGWRRA